MSEWDLIWLTNRDRVTSDVWRKNKQIQVLRRLNSLLLVASFLLLFIYAFCLKCLCEWPLPALEWRKAGEKLHLILFEMVVTAFVASHFKRLSKNSELKKKRKCGRRKRERETVVKMSSSQNKFEEIRAENSRQTWTAAFLIEMRW